jgi:hypothetical protein
MTGAGKSTPLRGADHVAPRVAPAVHAEASPLIGVDRIAARNAFRFLAEAFGPSPARLAAYWNTDAALGVARY